MTIASVSFLATCYWVNALACKAGGDNPTVEAPRHEAGFSCDFRAPKRRPAKEATTRENIDRPASLKVPIKNTARKRFFLMIVTVCIKHALEALESCFARN